MNSKIVTSIILIVLWVSSCKQYDSTETVEVSTKSELEPDAPAQIFLPTIQNKGKIIHLKKSCSYNDIFSDPEILIQEPSYRGLSQIKNILSFSGLPTNFEIFSANIQNAAAVIINNNRYILFDPNLLDYVDVNSDSYWASMSILAHEIGHHLSGHTLGSESDSKQNELEADKFSGFVLFKMGATLNQAQNAMSRLGSENDSDTHPSKYKRLGMIKQGWEEASQQRYESAIPPPPSDDSSFEGKYGYVKNEFFKNELINEIELADVNFGQVIDKYEYALQEGIIIDVHKSGTEGDLRADNFDREPSEYNLVLTIQSTKDYVSPYDEVTKKGTRFKYHLMDYFHTSRAEVSWLEAMLVPGRKIAFKSFYYGYGAEDIFYIKKLNR